MFGGNVLAIRVLIEIFCEKFTLDCTSFRNSRPVSNIAFMSKVIEKVIAF